ncbi:MAG: hypothetical protein DRN66_03700 [Candidatus Nanohalarchaeota archaeon]|nr:MAG: hypothetical protein DRN66_03700 [Candidatus Nanohaloarchaeota archaeon]
MSFSNTRLIAFDLDGTLLKEESVLELLKLQESPAKKLELAKKIIYYTKEKAIGAATEMNMLSSMLSGMEAEKYRQRIDSFELMQGADYVAKKLKKEGYALAILSDGFLMVANHVKRKLNFDYVFANELEVKNGILTGKLITPYNEKMPYSGCINHNLCKRKVLTDLCRNLKVELKDVVAVGNGTSDICFLDIAGKSIGFNPNSTIEEIADVSIKSNDLKDILPHIIN